MATLEKLTPGQILYQVKRVKMGNTNLSRQAIYEVKVLDVDLAKRTVLASWNTNPGRVYRERDVKTWRVSKPEPKRALEPKP